MIVWECGPPPRRDDGHVVLVRLRPDFDRFEYYGDPVAVCCWDSKLKTTIHPLRLEYEDVIEWSEIGRPPIFRNSSGQPFDPQPETPA